MWACIWFRDDSTGVEKPLVQVRRDKRQERSVWYEVMKENELEGDPPSTKTIIQESFTNDEFRLRAYTESRDCKPLKTFGLELLKMEDRTGRPPLICGMRMIVPKDDPQGKRLAAPIPVDDIHLLGNSQKREDAKRMAAKETENTGLKKGRGK